MRGLEDGGRRRLAAVMGIVLVLVLGGTRCGAAEVYLTEAEAPRAVFPHAERFERVVVSSTAELRRRVARRLGGVTPSIWEGRYTVFSAFGAGELVGRAIVVEEIGKHRPITFIVGVGRDEKVAGVAVMVYREPYGGEVRSRRFLGQYRGKTGSEPLLPGRDIRNITGATLSARAIGRGVKKALAVLAEIAPAPPSRPPHAAIPRTRVARAVPSGPVEVREAHYVMGTILEITLDAPDRATGQALIRRGVAIARRLDHELTLFDPSSALSRLNASAGRGVGSVPPDLFRVLALSLALCEETGGAFDVTVGPLVRLWRAARGRPPAPLELAQSVRVAVGNKIRLGPRGRVRLVRPGVEVDLGGIGKGYAADRIAERLRRDGVGRALIDFGHSTMVAVGGHPWRVWIRREDALWGPIDLRDRALSTSASVAVSTGGRPASVIVDPRTGRAVRQERQATVLAPTAAEAEAWSTALVVDPGTLLEALRRRDGLAAVVFEEGRRRMVGFGPRGRGVQGGAS